MKLFNNHWAQIVRLSCRWISWRTNWIIVHHHSQISDHPRAQSSVKSVECKQMQANACDLRWKGRRSTFGAYSLATLSYPLPPTNDITKAPNMVLVYVFVSNIYHPCVYHTNRRHKHRLILGVQASTSSMEQWSTSISICQKVSWAFSSIIHTKRPKDLICNILHHLGVVLRLVALIFGLAFLMMVAARLWDRWKAFDFHVSCPEPNTYRILVAFWRIQY